MPRAEQNKLYRTFVKGLITEAGPLTYPENASIEENNTVVFRKGNRTRRLGFDVEPNGVYQQNTPGIGFDANNAQGEYLWRSPGNIENLNLLVRQIGGELYFYDTSVQPLSAGKKAFAVNLFPLASFPDQGFKFRKLQFAQGKGVLFAVAQGIYPIAITYTPDSISIQTIVILIRDFEGVDDGLANEQEPVTLSNLHAYNLINQGWAPSSVSFAADGTPTGDTSTQVGSTDSGQSTYYNPNTGQPAIYYPGSGPRDVLNLEVQ